MPINNSPKDASPSIGRAEEYIDPALLNLVAAVERGAEESALDYRLTKARERALYKQAMAVLQSRAQDLAAPAAVTVGDAATAGLRALEATVRSAWRVVAEVVHDLDNPNAYSGFRFRGATRGASDRTEGDATASPAADGTIHSVSWQRSSGMLKLEWNLSETSRKDILHWTVEANIDDANGGRIVLPAKFKVFDDGECDNEYVFVDIGGVYTAKFDEVDHVSVRCVVSSESEWHVEVSFLSRRG